MGFEEIELDAHALGLLFKDGLMKLDQQEDVRLPNKLDAAPSHRFLGEHKKRISIFVNYTDAAFIPDPQLQFLTKILEACKLNLGDVGIFNQHSQNFQFETIVKDMKPSFVLSFGIPPLTLGLPMDFEKYKVMHYNSISFLCSHALEEMSLENAASKALKQKLWSSLKQIFSI